MKYIKQLVIILLFSFLGELLNILIPLPVPSSIYGMILLFLALCLKIVKLEQIEKTAEYLLSIMLIFFVPVSVGIMDTFFEYKSSMLPIILIVVVSTVVVIITTSKVSQKVIRLISRLERKKNNERSN